MPTYKYRAKENSGNITEGRLDAQSEKDAVERLSQMGYLPVSIEREKDTVKSTEFPSVNANTRVKSRHVTIFSRELASLLKSGVPILKAISIISEQSESQRLKGVLSDIYTAVKRGATFSSVLAQYPRVFSPLYVGMIYAGENSGDLPEALLRISDYRAKQEERFSRFRMALVYPALMAVVGIGTVVFMLTFVMPRLMQIFANMGQELPLPTQILIYTSQALRQGWYWIILVLALVVMIVKRQSNTRAGRLSLSLLKLHIPIFGIFMLKAELSRFCRTLELLIKNGIPILKAIDIAVPILQNEIIKDQLRQSYRELEQGSSFGRSLKKSKLFPMFMSNLLIVGEESGRLDEALGEIAASYEKDVDEGIKIMDNLLEPLMILGMGLIVGFVVIAMLLPIFEINV